MSVLKLPLLVCLILIFFGCAASPLIELPTTIPDSGVTLHYAFGRMPIPGGDTTNSTSASDEEIKVGDVEIYTPLSHWLFWGVQVGMPFPSTSQGAGPFSIMYPFYALQYSTSLSVKPVPFVIGSIWMGSRLLVGPVGGVEAMTGNEFFSIGGGWAEIEEIRSIPAGPVENGYAYLMARSVEYGRVAVGWGPIQVDTKIGYGIGNKYPWMWQMSIGLHIGNQKSASPHRHLETKRPPSTTLDTIQEGPESPSFPK